MAPPPPRRMRKSRQVGKKRWSRGARDVAAGRTYDADAFLAELEAEDASWPAEAALLQRNLIR